MGIEILRADYKNKKHGRDIGFLLNLYAQDPMGGETPLSKDVKDGLAEALSKISHAFTILCYVDEKPAGLINCFEGFSTFKCKPIINIHDVTVSSEFRGKGLSRMMLDEVEKVATERGCCKLTLEVLEGNKVAKLAYENFGFEGYQLDPEIGNAMFWEKVLR